MRLAGGRFLTRMTVMRLDDGLCLHSPVEIDAATRAAIEGLGEVRAIIAPSTFHHFFVASAQQAFPAARTYGIKGLDTKRKDLHFDELLGDEPAALWAGQMDQVVIGNRVMREVEFLHRASRTLIATDLVENFRDETPGTNAIAPRVDAPLRHVGAASPRSRATAVHARPEGRPLGPGPAARLGLRPRHHRPRRVARPRPQAGHSRGVGVGPLTKLSSKSRAQRSSRRTNHLRRSPRDGGARTLGGRKAGPDE